MEKEKKERATKKKTTRRAQRKTKTRYVTFGENMKRIRIDADLSQQELAAAVGSAQSVISSYEASKSEPNMMMQVAIADVLEVSLDELFGHKPIVRKRNRSATHG